MVKMNIKALPALKDNYIWVIFNSEHQAIVVDPGVADGVLNFLAEQQLKLIAILATHKHADHTAGIKGLLQQFPQVPVYGPSKDNVPLMTDDVVEGQILQLGAFAKILVLEIPGHTRGHVAYLIANNLFCGDTLFAAGCGRVFDGTYEELFASLQKMYALPDDTQIYCGHEYTLANLKFALAVEPGNKNIIERIKECEILRAEAKPTLPSNLALEKQTNPFLRVDSFARFKELREWKNSF